MFKLIVAGTRTFDDYVLAKSVIDRLRTIINDEVCIVSGTCKGADLLGERYAKENNLFVVQFKPDWELGRKAGPIRNEKMGNYADGCVVFFDGESRGTRSMINICNKLDKPCLVVNYKSNEITKINKK